MDTFLIVDDYSGHREFHNILAYNVMDALEKWGASHGNYYGSVLSIEKV